MIVDSFKFLPRTFRPLYRGVGSFPGEEATVWVPFAKRLSDSRIALLTSAGIYVKASQQPFDLERERAHPEWGDPTWRAIPATSTSGEIGVAHLHINDEDLLADLEIALPVRGLAELATDGVIGGVVDEHVSVMGYQDRGLDAWRDATAPQVVERLRMLQSDGVILAPA